MQTILTWKGIWKACAVTAGREQNSFFFGLIILDLLNLFAGYFSVLKMLKFMIFKIKLMVCNVINC